MSRVTAWLPESGYSRAPVNHLSSFVSYDWVSCLRFFRSSRLGINPAVYHLLPVVCQYNNHNQWYCQYKTITKHLQNGKLALRQANAPWRRAGQGRRLRPIMYLIWPRWKALVNQGPFFLIAPAILPATIQAIPYLINFSGRNRCIPPFCGSKI